VNLSPIHIWESMGLLSKIIASLLLLMAAASLAVMIERIIHFAKSGGQSASFARQAGPMIDTWDFEPLVALANRHASSPLARLVGPTVKKFAHGFDDKDAGVSPVELAKRESARQQEAIGSELRRGFGVLSSVGSISPFVGLLGTVVGIITAFQGIASSTSGGLNAVSAGIAEALVETALGLMVAIPAVLSYNYLSARVATIEGNLNRSAGELIDQLESDYGRRTDSTRQIQKAA
jgi:biopolymer transport protein ExbB